MIFLMDTSWVSTLPLGLLSRAGRALYSEKYSSSFNRKTTSHVPLVIYLTKTFQIWVWVVSPLSDWLVPTYLHLDWLKRRAFDGWYPGTWKLFVHWLRPRHCWLLGLRWESRLPVIATAFWSRGETLSRAAVMVHLWGQQQGTESSETARFLPWAFWPWGGFSGIHPLPRSKYTGGMKCQLW